jgi:hypothetical protein
MFKEKIAEPPSGLRPFTDGQMLGLALQRDGYAPGRHSWRLTLHITVFSSSRLHSVWLLARTCRARRSQKAFPSTRCFTFIKIRNIRIILACAF